MIFMNILVCIKAVPEPEQVISFTGKSPVITVDADTPLRMNRFDEYAVEAAVQIKQAIAGTLVDVVTVGPPNAAAAVKRAMGMGADRGFHAPADYFASGDADRVSRCIAGFAAEKGYDLVLTGVMSEDMMQSQVSPMLAERLGLPWATSVVCLRPDAEHSKIYVEQERDGGLIDMMEIDLPALLSIQTGINEPRYPSVSKLLRANQAGVEPVPAPDADPAERPVQVDHYDWPEKQRAGRVLEGTTQEKARQLHDILKQRGLL